MLTALKHRGAESKAMTISVERELTIAIGCSTHPETKLDLANSSKSIVAFNGSFYERNTIENARLVLRRTENSPPIQAIRQIENEIGGFASLVAARNRLYEFRDINGLKPLYYAHGHHLTAYASERKALWRLGLKDTQPIAPGSATTLTRKGITEKRLVHFNRPKEQKMTIGQATAKLSRLLTRSVQRITRNNRKVAVGFSGGLDSALTAAIALNEEVDLEGVSVGLSGSSELSTVERFADELGLPLTVETFSSDSLEEYVRRVIWLIEEPNMMKVSVAVPLHWRQRLLPAAVAG